MTIRERLRDLADEVDVRIGHSAREWIQLIIIISIPAYVGLHFNQAINIITTASAQPVSQAETIQQILAGAYKAVCKIANKDMPDSDREDYCSCAMRGMYREFYVHMSDSKATELAKDSKAFWANLSTSPEHKVADKCNSSTDAY